MKKIILSLAVLTTGLVFAQKGTVLVGGSIGFNNTDENNSKKNEFYFTPQLGYQFSDHVTAGLDANFSTLKDDEGVFSAYEKETTYSFGPFVQYAVPFSDIFSAYAELGAGYKKATYSASTLAGASNFDVDGFYAKLTPVLFINFKDSFGLNIAFGGLKYNKLSGDNYDSKEFVIDFGRNFGLGISKNF